MVLDPATGDHDRPRAGFYGGLRGGGGHSWGRDDAGARQRTSGRVRRSVGRFCGRRSLRQASGVV